MVYANIEYLSKTRGWQSLATFAFASGDLLISGVAGLIAANYPRPWRMRVRY